MRKASHSKLLWPTLLISLLFTFKICMCNSEIRNSIQEYIGYAAEYYQQIAQHYYLKYTGQLPDPPEPRYSPKRESFVTLCDFLLLTEEESEDLYDFYDQTYERAMRKTRRSNRRTPAANPRSFFESFDQLHKEVAEKMMTKFSEFPEEIDGELIETIISRPFSFPIVELRALRSIDLDWEQRKELLPYTARLAECRVPFHRSFSRRERERDSRIAMMEAFESEKEKFIQHVREILSIDQNKEWISKTIQIQAQFDEHRFRGFRGRRERDEKRANSDNFPA